MTTSASAATPPPGAALADIALVGKAALAQARMEITVFFRERDTVIFTFLLPVILLLVFGAIFHGDIGHTGVPFRQYFVTGIIASGIMSTTFVNLGAGIVAERDNGVLTLLATTPMPRPAYFLGKAISAMVISCLEVAVLLGFGVTLFGLRLPATPARWVTFGWVFILGAACCAMVGVALSSVPKTSRASSAIFNLAYLVLSFISGVYFVFSSLPAWLQRVAAAFPLKWLCQGLRSAFLPDSLLAAEPARSWEHGKLALVLGAWLVAGLVLCVTTFRWHRQRR